MPLLLLSAVPKHDLLLTINLSSYAVSFFRNELGHMVNAPSPMVAQVDCGNQEAFPDSQEAFPSIVSYAGADDLAETGER